MFDPLAVTAAADFVVNGYAFTSSGDQVKVVNLHSPDHATVFNSADVMIATSMDDIELEVVRQLLAANREFLELASA